jgi:hypothetical protein
MNTRPEDDSRNNNGFILGLFAGTVAGAATRSYEQANAGVAHAIDELTARGQAAGDALADAVAQGARRVEQFAGASKPDSRRS